MISGSDVRRRALQIEEAALLPALPRHGALGSAALRDALRSAADMEKMRLSNAVQSMIPAEITGPQTGNAAPRGRDRAALHHVLRR